MYMYIYTYTCGSLSIKGVTLKHPRARTTSQGVHACMHACIHASVHACMHACMHEGYRGGRNRDFHAHRTKVLNILFGSVELRWVGRCF